MKGVIRYIGLAELAAAIALLSAVLSIKDETRDAGLLVGVVALVPAVALVFARFKQGRREGRAVSRLQEILEFKRVLQAAGRHAGFGDAGGGWRLSLYELEVGKRIWVLKGRVASNPLHEGLEDMKTLDVKQGVLRSCLEQAELPGGGFDEMPVLAKATSADWYRILDAWALKKTLMSRQVMKSRAYCGAVFRVGGDSDAEATIGVVLESEAPNGVNRGQLEAALTRPFFEVVGELLKIERAIDKELGR